MEEDRISEQAERSRYPRLDAVKRPWLGRAAMRCDCCRGCDGVGSRGGFRLSRLAAGHAVFSDLRGRWRSRWGCRRPRLAGRRRRLRAECGEVARRSAIIWGSATMRLPARVATTSWSMALSGAGRVRARCVRCCGGAATLLLRGPPLCSASSRAAFHCRRCVSSWAVSVDSQAGVAKSSFASSLAKSRSKWARASIAQAERQVSRRPTDARTRSPGHVGRLATSS